MSKNKTVRNIFLILCCFVICVTSAYAESSSKSGATQNKYTASGCSYTTQTRTCCANYQWSEWGKDCTCNEDGRDVRDCESSDYAKVCAKWGSGFQCIAKYLNTERYYYKHYTCKFYERRDDFTPGVSSGSCDYINPKEYSM